MERFHRKPLKQPTEQYKALQRKYRSRREDDQHLRRQAHRNAAEQAQKQANQAKQSENANQEANKAPLERKKDASPDPVPKFPHKGSRRTWEIVSEKRWTFHRYEVAEEDSSRKYRVLKLANKVTFSEIDIPGLSFLDDDHKYFWTRIPRVRSPILFRCVEYDLDLDEAPQLQPSLRRYVSAVFSKGIEYHVKPDNIFVTKKLGSKGPFWALFLLGWMETELHRDLMKTDPEEWKRREKKQLDEIDCIFAEARRLHIEAMPFIEDLKKRGRPSSWGLPRT